MLRPSTILFTLLFPFFTCFASTDPLFDSAAFGELPVSYQGRYREIHAYSNLWLYDLYHSPNIRKVDQPSFQASNSLDLLWKIHFAGSISWRDTPLFWLDNKMIKQLLHLEPRAKRFSYSTLHKSLSQPEFLQALISLTFSKKHADTSNRSRSNKLELSELAPGLWVETNGINLHIVAKPETYPWNTINLDAFASPPHRLKGEEESLLNEMFAIIGSLKTFESYTGSLLSSEIQLAESVTRWKQQGKSNKEISLLTEEHFPLDQRLKQAGSTFKMLPGRRHKGEWYSLHALTLQVFDSNTGKLAPSHNFTAYPTDHFDKIRTTYNALQNSIVNGDMPASNLHASRLAALLKEGYAHFAGKPVKTGEEKLLLYPTLGQLKAETFYYRYPLIEIALIFYGAAFCGFLLAWRINSRQIEWGAIFLLAIGFLIHTLIIALRCYILSRPPVSNMFETVIYVPWIGVLLSLILRPFLKTSLLFAASSAAAIALLVLLLLTNSNSSMDNVQAVLDSQYWLIIHVMMIVGSYGVFILSGILAHVYLTAFLLVKNESTWLKYTASCVLQTLYIGVALLIPGTILGGVWAAQSWGRFWDWDPKESWAFISSCIYLAGIHAYRFGYINNFGLSISSIFGMMAISFTWYGVNYLLGTGLHSYGFGSGGDGYYYAYLLAECLFIAICTYQHKNCLREKEKVRY